MHIRIPGPYIPNVRLEMLDIDDVESDDCGVESYVCFCDFFAEIEGAFSLGEMLLYSIERGEECDDGFFVCFLGSSKAGFVNAIVDVVIGPVISSLDLGLQVGGEEIQILVLGFEKVIKLQNHVSLHSSSNTSLTPGKGTNLSIKHPNNFTTLITDNLPLLHIIKRRHRKPSLILRIDLEIDIPQMLIFLMSRNRIWGNVLAGGIGVRGLREMPSLFLHVPVDGGEGDYGFETFELADDEGSVGPGAGVGYLMALR